jgi:hypothetical protein
MRIPIILFFPALVVLVIYSLSSQAQEYKREKEERIRKGEMPEKAIQVLSPFLKQAKRTRFYFETDGERKSYECKLKFRGTKYSIEFNESGDLEDVEFVVSGTDLPDITRKAIYKYLETEYDRYVISEFQKQYSSDKPDIKDERIIASALADNEIGMIIRYELEVDGNQDQKLISHELLFDNNGLFMRKRTIIRRQIDNILY